MASEGRLSRLADGTTVPFRTDDHGRYQSGPLQPGRYRLILSEPGFASQNLLVEVPSSGEVARKVVMNLGSSVDRVDVVASTPLNGGDLDVNEVASPVQTASSRDIQASGALNLPDLLNRRFSGIFINEMQGNPFQPDVNFRGFTASALLGTPQGLSVYMDGVRLNQPFGDVVSWDLIPRNAIADMSLVSGSNPMFGLNTLGGAIAIRTKDGRRDPGLGVEFSGGSYGRKQGELEYGGSNAKGWSWFGAGTLFFEDGWRQASPTNVRQSFGKLNWQGAATTLGLTVGYANNSLIGNGLQDGRLLAKDYSSVYTIPDQTLNRAPFLNLYAQHSFNSRLSVSGNAYYRYIRTNTLNGDINDDALDQSVYQPSASDIRALTAAGYSGFPTSGANASSTPFPFWRCIAQALQGDEPAEKCNGLLNRSRSQQNNYGIAGQMTWLSSGLPVHHQLTVGAAYDGSTTNFSQLTELGYLNPDHSVTGVGAFGDGVTGGDEDGVPFDTRVDIRGRTNTGSVYATDTFSGRRWALTLSGRYNRTTLDNFDRIIPSGTGTLTGTHSFGRFNPSIGFVATPTELASVYVNYSQASRAPTSIELGCADPDLPCKLPNSMAGDPPLKQVVTYTVETGIRGKLEQTLNWRAGYFWTENHNDILFVAASQTSYGYFKNFGKTRRQGMEANLNAQLHRVSLGGAYTFLDATYQSPESVDGSSNSTNEAALDGEPGMEGAIHIQPGNQIPLMPRHMLKAFASLQATRKLTVGINFIAASSSFARGNENNLSQPDGTYYLGSGKSPGYGVTNLSAQYQAHPKLQFFVQLNNIFDHHYYTAAQLGPAGFTEQGYFRARPLPAVDGEYPLVHTTFYAPGAPFGAWGGVRLRF